MEESTPARLIKVMEGSCDKNETSVVLSSLLPDMYGFCVAKFIQLSVVITSSVFSDYSQWTHGDVKAWKRFPD